jgi:peptidoglycan-associated lipoprotein
MLSKPKKTMKFNTVLNMLAMVALLCASAVGCKNMQRVTPIPGRGVGTIGDQRPGGLSDAQPITGAQPTRFDPAGPGVPGTTLPLNTWQPSPEQPFRSDTVYFDFDKSTVKPSEVSKIETVANGMKSHAGKALRIEGHCDERGTEEYNRSLGERRAQAVREHLVRLGMDAQLIDTVSYGEDKPAESGHNEAAWSKNRRGEFILLDPPGGSASTK